MDDPSKETSGDNETAPTEEGTVENSGPMPYAYIVNVPELSFMLPAIPELNSATYGTILKAYRDAGFSFRVRPNQTSEPATVGDVVKVGYTNPVNLSGGYYVGNESLAGTHPGTNSGGGSGKGGTATGKPLGGKRKTKAKGAERAKQNQFLDLVDNAKEEISNYKCNFNVPRISYSSFEEFAGGSYAAMEENDKLMETYDFFGIGNYNSPEPKGYKFRSDIHHSLDLAKQLICQDPPSLRYMAETIYFWKDEKGTGSSGGKNLRGSWGSYVVKCKANALNDAGKAYWTSKGKKCKPSSKTKGWNCGPGTGNKKISVFKGYCQSGSPSNHAHGTAFDLNSLHNPMLSGVFTTDMPPTFVACLEACGWHWGGRYGSATGGTASDPMHWEYKAKRPVSQQAWNDCQTAIANGEKDFYQEEWLDRGSTPKERAEAIINDPYYGEPGHAMYTKWYWNGGSNATEKREGGNPAHMDNPKPAGES